MCRRTGSKYAWPLYLRSRFNLTTTNPLETAGLGEILDKFPVSIGMLQILFLILEISRFPCVIAIFLNKIVLGIVRTFSNFFKFFNSSGLGSRPILLHTTWHGIYLLLRNHILTVAGNS